MIDIQTLIMPVIVAGFGIFAVGTWAYRKATVQEPFQLVKFLPTMGIGALAALVVYFASGAIPSMDQIMAQVALMMPGGVPSLSVIVAAILAVYNAVSKGDNPLPTLPSYVKPADAPGMVPVEGTEPVAVGAWSPGFTCTPVEQKGVSPFAALVTAVVGNDSTLKRCMLRVDWMDGTPIEDYRPNALTGAVVMTHGYDYQQGMSKYTGHQYYPKFTLISSAGVPVGEFNTIAKCCSIEVQSKQ